MERIAYTAIVILIALFIYQCEKEEKENDFSGDTGTFTDQRDGVKYEWIRIGDQIWMAENLKSTIYADGTPLVDGTGAGNIYDEHSAKYYFWYDDDEKYAETYGALYTWSAAMNGAKADTSKSDSIQGVCPDGWHLPGESEWEQLKTYLGGYDQAGKKMKEAGTDHWEAPNTGATNESGFSALPAGSRNYEGRYNGLGTDAYFWSSTISEESTHAVMKMLDNQDGDLGEDALIITYGCSVRCIKDD
jgi:uncharacterized protein (TIGR02145 family)